MPVPSFPPFVLHARRRFCILACPAAGSAELEQVCWCCRAASMCQHMSAFSSAGSGLFPGPSESAARGISDSVPFRPRYTRFTRFNRFEFSIVSTFPIVIHHFDLCLLFQRFVHI